MEDAAWKAMVAGLVKAGVRRIRLTGGEPLLHPHAVELIEHLSTLGLEDIALTTNATRLEKLAAPLRRAGLARITISLDSLLPERFFRMTRGGQLSRVLAGIDAALAAGFDEVKINAVVLRGENDDELEPLTRWAWQKGATPRFIEVMKVGEGARLGDDKLVTVAEMRASLAHLLRDDVARADPGRGPARYLHAADNPHNRVGFISGTSDTYCESCDRLRVSSDGMLRPCLATNDGLSAAAHAVDGDVDAIAAAVGEAWALKPDGQTWKGCTEPTAADVSMRAIGG
jgi:GTP 3',8-cyclase